ncbi:MAG: sulfatase-like hydrolase/transferase [Endomicrobium sp.]|jgi:phosphoglycerol transferase MdoB-like AlkP superfamily enzyme|nr:sulfatase-like hydrolase/transferase [Endomicrobium sp.]
MKNKTLKLRNNFFRLELSIAYLLIFLAIFFISRTALYIAAQTFFKGVPITVFICVLVQGMRFDIFAICTFCGAFIFLLNLPVNSKKFIKIICAFLNVFILVFLFVLAADVIYFTLFEKHLTTEFLLAESHFGYFLSLAFGEYIFMTILIIAMTVLLFYFSLKIIDKFYTPPNRKIVFNAVVLAVMTCLIIIAVRGGLQERILSISDAYKKGRIMGELKLNGIFTSLISIRSKTEANKINIEFEDALNIVKKALADPGEFLPNEKYPLMRQRIKFNVVGKGYNVIIILLESWQKDYIDSMAGTSYGVTPNFDALVKKSIVYDRFYANGQRSIMGLMSVFFGFPYVRGLPYMGYGLENFGQTRLPLILAENGYDNVFVQGDKRESDNAIALANYLGFKEAYGKQDIPLLNRYDANISKGYDLDGLQFFFNKVNLLKRPFFAFYFTTTTHIPYAKTILKSLEKYQEDGTEKTGYLNRLYYADHALGEFMRQSENEPWFENTVFIMCSDHQAYGIGGKHGEFEKTKMDKTFKIPMIIYSPALFKPEVNNELGSQFDIVPTIIDILNIETPYSSLGKSLFSKADKRFAFLSYEGDQVYLINNEGAAWQDWKAQSNSSYDMNKENGKLLFSVEKTIYNLIIQDKWFDKKKLN